MKEYDRQILQILSEVGERGISVGKLAKHVYNLNCTLFETPDMTRLHAYVQQYLLRNSRSQSSLVERTGRRGYYRLNTRNSAQARQLVLTFLEGDDAEPEKEEEKPQQDFSLSLF